MHPRLRFVKNSSARRDNTNRDKQACVARLASLGGDEPLPPKETNEAVKNTEGLRERGSGRGGTGGDDDPYPLSWRGIDNLVYYMVDLEQYVQLINYSGCGNTVSGNHPVTKRLIIDSLRQCGPLGTLSLPPPVPFFSRSLAALFSALRLGRSPLLSPGGPVVLPCVGSLSFTRIVKG